MQRTEVGKIRSPYNWEAINEKFSDDVIRQAKDGSCSAAVGEMLTAGKVTEAELIEEIGAPTDIRRLAPALGSERTSAKEQIPVAVIDQKFLDQLRAAGLFVSSSYPSFHVCPDAVRVGKPLTTRGNSIPGYEISWEGVALDAPTVVLYTSENRWIVVAQEYSPTAGPGDFIDIWDTPDEAVKDILDLFLGDGTRMAKKAERELAMDERIRLSKRKRQ